jgi:hypothetical protein
VDHGRAGPGAVRLLQDWQQRLMTAGRGRTW